MDIKSVAHENCMYQKKRFKSQNDRQISFSLITAVIAIYIRSTWKYTVVYFDKKIRFAGNECIREQYKVSPLYFIVVKAKSDASWTIQTPPYFWELFLWTKCWGKQKIRSRNGSAWRVYISLSQQISITKLRFALQNLSLLEETQS